MTNEERKKKREAFRQKWAEVAKEAEAKDLGITTPKRRKPYNELVDDELAAILQTILHFHPDCVQVDIVLQPTETDDPDTDSLMRAIRLWRDTPSGPEKIDAPEFQGDIDERS